MSHRSPAPVTVHDLPDRAAYTLQHADYAMGVAADEIERIGRVMRRCLATLTVSLVAFLATLAYSLVTL